MNDNATEMVWILINRAADLLRFDAFHSVGGEMESYTVSQRNVLGVIYTHPDCGLMVKDIAAKMNITCGAVSQTVDSLVKLGMLERLPSKKDRRVVFVRATLKGIATRKKLVARTRPILSQIFSEVKTPEQSSFLGLLEKLVEQLAAMNEARNPCRSAT